MPSRAASASWPDRILAGSIGALVLLAWYALWLWGRSPGGHLLMHGAGHLAATANNLGYYTAIFVAGWTLMTIAMMLPTVTPLLILFRRMAAARANAALLLATVVAGYLAVWIVFGLAVQAANRYLAQPLLDLPWVASRPWLPAVSILTLAGLFQFSTLKYACLEKCRTPLSFIASHWQGGNEYRQAFRIGAGHGLYCVGCCWSLMLLMFLTGAGNLVWMLLLGVVMAAEKNFPWGRKVGKPIGAVLLLTAAGLALRAA